MSEMVNQPLGDVSIQNDNDWISLEGKPQERVDVLNHSMISRLFPEKDQSKRDEWLKVLLDNEFEKLSDMENLLESDWNMLSLPMAVKIKLKSELNPVESMVTENKCTSNSSSLNQNIVVESSQDEPPEVSQVDCIVVDI